MKSDPRLKESLETPEFENTSLKEALEYLQFFPKELKKELKNKKSSSSSISAK
jgi:hypothetical protein